LEDKELLHLADGRVSLLYMGGPMSFGIAKTIFREHLTVKHCDSLVMDLSDVSYMDETAALALEDAIKDSRSNGSHVFIVGAAGKVRQLLESLGILKLVPFENQFTERTDALKRAVVLEGAQIALQTG
jgi:SulP family sulfate permease